MTSSALVYLIALPLLGSAILLLAGRRIRSLGSLVGHRTVGFILRCWSSYYLFKCSVASKTNAQSLRSCFHGFQWGSFKVDAGLMLDQLSICFVLLITGVGTLIHIYSIAYMSHDLDRRRFFAYLNFFIAAMLLLVLGDST